MAAKDVLITSCTGFDGYKVVKYSGYISEDAVQALTTNVGTALFGGATKPELVKEKLQKIRQEVIEKMKEDADDMGCNAIIGLDLDYFEMSTPGVNGVNNFVLSGNGNAVVIEKI